MPKPKIATANINTKMVGGKKEIKKKDYGTSKKNNTNLSNVNVVQVLSNNISILNNNISQYHNNDLDNILNIMIETSSNIIRHKKNMNQPIQYQTITNVKKLIGGIQTSRQNIQISNLRKIKIKSIRKIPDQPK